MVSAQLKELLLQSLTHERGGVLVYQTALECAVNEDLRKEWTEYLAQTEKHVEVLQGVCTTLGLDPGEMTPGCKIVQHTGKSLVVAMKMALAEGDPAAAEIVACEAVVLAETKDHADWELIGQCAKALEGQAAQVLQDAYDAIEDEEDEHLYHTKGWCRELWLKALGLDATLPPPEETKDVKSAAEAAQVVEARKDKPRARAS
jgi:rubrerythrin